MTRIARIALALAAATLGACGGANGYGTTAPPGPPGDGKTVAATTSLTFTPNSLAVNVGDIVTFAFGTVAHNVFFDAQANSPADIAGVNANQSVQRTFTAPGTYKYTCHIHPGMQGQVVVR